MREKERKDQKKGIEKHCLMLDVKVNPDDSVKMPNGTDRIFFMSKNKA